MNYLYWLSILAAIAFLYYYYFSGKTKSAVTICGSGEYLVDVTRESQEALRTICAGSSEKFVRAYLTIEADKSVRVDVNGLSVGYLSRENSRHYYLEMRYRRCLTANVSCGAKIMGSWGVSNEGQYTLKLDLGSN